MALRAAAEGRRKLLGISDPARNEPLLKGNCLGMPLLQYWPPGAVH